MGSSIACDPLGFDSAVPLREARKQLCFCIVQSIFRNLRPFSYESRVQECVYRGDVRVHKKADGFFSAWSRAIHLYLEIVCSMPGEYGHRLEASYFSCRCVWKSMCRPFDVSLA